MFPTLAVPYSILLSLLMPQQPARLGRLGYGIKLDAQQLTVEVQNLGHNL